MKEKYEEMKMEVVAFTAEDVVTASQNQTVTGRNTYVPGDSTPTGDGTVG